MKEKYKRTYNNVRAIILGLCISAIVFNRLNFHGPEEEVIASWIILILLLIVTLTYIPNSIRDLKKYSDKIKNQ